MLQRNQLQNGRVIEFEYIRSEGREGDEWHLAFLVIDAVVAGIVGLENLEVPPFLERHPQSILRPLYRVLHEHKLDGGIVEEWPDAGEGYGITITIKERTLKPNQ